MEKNQEDRKQGMTAHHKINGVATDLLVHIDVLIDDPEKDIPHWSEHLAKKTGISLEEATKLVEHHYWRK
ncbi:MAG: hypothetical protein KAH48_06230 [Chlorobi bacterium]|nr:hypothetical protein [Chlorobiota bacterium]